MRIVPDDLSVRGGAAGKPASIQLFDLFVAQRFLDPWPSLATVLTGVSVIAVVAESSKMVPR